MYLTIRTLTALAFCLSVGCAETRKSAPSEPAISPASTHDAAVPADAHTSDSGLVSLVLASGRGDARPSLHDKVRLNFTAWNPAGEIVDGSDKRGGPVTFEVSGVIAGFREALQQMRVAERRRLWIPDQLVYPGRPGFPRPPAVFELELLEIISGMPARPAPHDVALPPPDAIKTRSGLAYKLLKKGGGTDRPRPWDRVSVRYAGWSSEGRLLESSRPERPSVFAVDKVMPGWSEGLALLSVGDEARLWIPEALASQGRVGEPRGSVVFELELVSIERRPEPPRPPSNVASAPRTAKRTRSGLAYRFLVKGPGHDTARASDRVEVHYSAWTSDGKLFDSSVVRGSPSTLPVSRVIPGWAEGLQLMSTGDRALFWIPEKLAYAGRAGSPPGMLVYDVELLNIVR